MTVSVFLLGPRKKTHRQFSHHSPLPKERKTEPSQRRDFPSNSSLRERGKMYIEPRFFRVFINFPAAFQQNKQSLHLLWHDAKTHQGSICTRTEIKLGNMPKPSAQNTSSGKEVKQFVTRKKLAPYWHLQTNNTQGETKERDDCLLKLG